MYGKRLAHLQPLNDQISSTRIPCEVVTMLGHSSLPDAVLAFQSMFRYAGVPERTTLISDGTLSPGSVKLLERVLAPAKVTSLQAVLSPSLPGVVAKRIDESWMVAKQAILMSFPQDRPTLFLDTDIVFFPAAERLASDLEELGDRPAFMCDAKPSFDERLFRTDDPREPPLNSGLLYLPVPIDWTKSVARFGQLPCRSPLAFTDQTMSHLAFHQAGALPMDQGRYVLQIDDQFQYRDSYANKPGIVCRHYVSSIRHKMWMLQDRWS